MLAPRIVNQQAIDSIMVSLHRAANDARAEAQRVDAALAGVQAQRSETEAAAAQLHERLLLGARMLKAFQAQIERIESLMEGLSSAEERLSRLDRALETRAAALEARLTEATTGLETRVNDLVERAVASLETRLREREDAISEAAGRLSDIESRFTSVVDRATASEAVMHAADETRSRHAAMAREVTTALRGAIDESRQSRDLLAEETRLAAHALVESKALAEPLIERLSRVAREAQCRAIELETHLVQSRAIADYAERAETMRSQIDQLLARLEPWTPVLSVLMDAKCDALIAERIGRVKRCVREGVRAEVDRLALGLRHVADAAATFAGASDEPAADTTPPAEPPVIITTVRRPAMDPAIQRDSD